MKRFLLICSFCLSFILVFNSQQICSGAENTTVSKKNQSDTAGKKWSRWVFADAYKIGRGDILDIMTWKEPDFTRGEVLVRIDGKISFPSAW